MGGWSGGCCAARSPASVHRGRTCLKAAQSLWEPACRRWSATCSQRPQCTGKRRVLHAVFASSTAGVRRLGGGLSPFHADFLRLPSLRPYRPTAQRPRRRRRRHLLRHQRAGHLPVDLRQGHRAPPVPAQPGAAYRPGLLVLHGADGNPAAGLQPMDATPGIHLAPPAAVAAVHPGGKPRWLRLVPDPERGLDA